MVFTNLAKYVLPLHGTRKKLYSLEKGKITKVIILAVFALTFTDMLFAQKPLGKINGVQKVVFYGDSITQGGWYLYYIQLFYATRFPDMRITIENAGVSGASATTSLPRLESDVLSSKPDIVYIMFGMNDVGRNYYRVSNPNQKTMEAREKSLETYKNKMNETIKRIKASGASPVILTPSPYNQYGMHINVENFVECNEGLIKCAEIAKALALENNSPAVDIHSPMTELLVKYPELKFAARDRIHPGKFGHMIMAYYILLSQNVPGLVCKATIDVKTKSVENIEKCLIKSLEIKDGCIKFMYIPKALPFPVSEEYMEAKRIVPWDSLNQEIIQIKNLADGNYKLLVAGKEIEKFSAEQFERGVNIALLTTPSQKKSNDLRTAVIKKANAESPLRNIAQVNSILQSSSVDPSDTVAANKYFEYFCTKLNDKLKRYYTRLFETYCKNRGKFPELTKKAVDAQKNIFELQKPEPFEIEIVRSINPDRHF
ncbi:MAG: Lipolytic enzyme, G-D-S-L [Candidatus Uhrbacteria bacterium GW2011_GWF2_39_13]|uniref:Lipolytic enzyme, G-D-S-L n=1 Tax=Candidatus Uhrbacteria bacterium GW2011_GWF2_39_13 TaxID=1618995 RepID=A0A0G0MK36_9BACT|nr:MAG: Lipolytic enzyme, G-D-S-L [Candidatus Uhrbacteria bacterium GW2011_GWF2_39_13]